MALSHTADPKQSRGSQYWSNLQKLSPSTFKARDEYESIELREIKPKVGRNLNDTARQPVTVERATLPSVAPSVSTPTDYQESKYIVQPLFSKITGSAQEQLQQLNHHLAKLQAYIASVSKAQEDKISPFDVITPNRDLKVSLLEAYVPETVARLNDKHPGLNLHCFNSSEAFAEHTKALCKAGKQAGIERGIFYVKAHLDDGTLIRHAICTETKFTESGAKIRAYDSIGKDKSERFFNRVCKDIFGDDNRQGKNIKLKWFAFGTQTARLGCDIYGISVAVKSFKLPAAATDAAFNSADWDHMSGPQLIADPGAVYNPPKFYTHAQSQKTIAFILQKHPNLENEIVHKKAGKTISEFHNDSHVDQVVDDIETGELNVVRTFGDSINTKRIFYLRQLESDIKKSISALVPAQTVK